MVSNAVNRIVFMGKRNMGKTSLIRSRIIPRFRSKHSDALIVIVDLLGVRELDHISQRFQQAFSRAINATRSAETLIRKITRTLANVRPRMSFDPLTGNPEFSLGIEEGNSLIPFSTLIAQMAQLHRDQGALLVMDEFQDIAEIPEAEALFRSALQELPGDLPVIAMGSKKHILARIFAAPGAPLANWGRPLEIGTITAADYLPYFNERLEPIGSRIDLTTMQALIESMSFVPEAINMVGDWWQRHRQDAGTLDEMAIEAAIAGILVERESLFREYIGQFSAKVERVLTVLSRQTPVTAPQSASFLAATGLSSGGMGSLIRRLEDRAIIYREPVGIILADPLIGHWLRRYY